MVKTQEEIRPDSDAAPEPVAKLGALARVNATAEPPGEPAKSELLEAADEDLAPEDQPRGV